MGLSCELARCGSGIRCSRSNYQIKGMHSVKLNKDDKSLKNALLNEVEGNIATLKGNAKSYLNGKEQSPLALIDESINDLTELKKLLKGLD